MPSWRNNAMRRARPGLTALLLGAALLCALPGAAQDAPKSLLPEGFEEPAADVAAPLPGTAPDATAPAADAPGTDAQFVRPRPVQDPALAPTATVVDPFAVNGFAVNHGACSRLAGMDWPRIAARIKACRSSGILLRRCSAG